MQISQIVYSYFYKNAYCLVKVLDKLEFIKLRNNDIYGQVPQLVSRKASLLKRQRKRDSIFVLVRATGSTWQNIVKAGSIVSFSEFPEVNEEDEKRELDQPSSQSFTVIDTTTSENVRSSILENEVVDAEQPSNNFSVDNETVLCPTAATTEPLSSPQQGEKLYDFDIGRVENEYSSAV